MATDADSLAKQSEQQSIGHHPCPASAHMVLFKPRFWLLPLLDDAQSSQRPGFGLVFFPLSF
jgi:hypothetical protein